MTWQPDSKTRLTIDALAQNTPSLSLSDPLPLAYLRSSYADRRDYAGDEGKFKQRQWMLGYSFEHEFDSGWGFNQKRATLTWIPISAASIQPGQGARSINSIALLTPRMKTSELQHRQPGHQNGCAGGMETSSAGRV